MTHAQAITAALIAVCLLANTPFAIFLLTRKAQSMPVLPEFQAALDELNAVASGIAQAKQAAADAAVAAYKEQAAQDLTDTAAAVQAAADAAKAAV